MRRKSRTPQAFGGLRPRSGPDGRGGAEGFAVGQDEADRPPVLAGSRSALYRVDFKLQQFIADGAEAVGQSSRVSLMISSKVRPRKSAALRQSTMRSRKISKYSITGQMFVSIVTENTQSLFSASIFSEAFSTA